FDIVSRSKFSYRPAADRPRAEARYHSATVCSSLLHFVARCTLLHPVAPCQKCRKPNKIAICCTVAPESVFLLITLSCAPESAHFSQSHSLNSTRPSIQLPISQSLRF